MTLFLAGGGPDAAPAEAYDAFAAAARRRGRSIAIVLPGNATDPDAPSRDTLLASYRDPLASRLPDVDFHPVWVGDDQAGWPDDWESLAGLVVADGGTDCPGYLGELTAHRGPIAQIVRHGVSYLGFATGAAAAAKHAILGGWRFAGHAVCPQESARGLDDITVGEGLALIGTTIECRADTQWTLGRAVAALRQGLVSSVAVLDTHAVLAVDAVSGQAAPLGTGAVSWLERVGDDVLVLDARRDEPGEGDGTQGGKV